MFFTKKIIALCITLSVSGGCLVTAVPPGVEEEAEIIHVPLRSLIVPVPLELSKQIESEIRKDPNLPKNHMRACIKGQQKRDYLIANKSQQMLKEVTIHNIGQLISDPSIPAIHPQRRSAWYFDLFIEEIVVCVPWTAERKREYVSHILEWAQHPQPIASSKDFLDAMPSGDFMGHLFPNGLNQFPSVDEVVAGQTEVAQKFLMQAKHLLCLYTQRFFTDLIKEKLYPDSIEE